MGQEVMESLTPAQQVVKIVNEELVALMLSLIHISCEARQPARERKVPNPAGNREIRVQRSELSGSGRFYFSRKKA